MSDTGAEPGNLRPEIEEEDPDNLRPEEEPGPVDPEAENLRPE